MLLFFVSNLVAQNSLLYEISGNGIKGKSYLLGTIHIIPTQDFYFPSHYTKCIKKSKNVVMEIDISDMVGQLQVLMKMNMEKNTLKDLYTTEEYNFVKQTLKDSFQIDIKTVESTKPIFIQQQLTGADNSAIMSGKMKSYEIEIYTLGAKLKKKFGGLETAVEQMSILDSIPLKEQAQMLLESLKEIHKSKVEMQKMYSFYKNQQLDSLSAMFEKDELDIKEYEDQLLNNRNTKWIPMMEIWMKKSSTFFAVGAGHLGGKNGVIELLKKRGYKVKPIYK